MPRARILVVEDELIVAADIQHRLQALGYDVAGATSLGEEALTLADQQRPDLVLMDIRLGDEMDGITAAERIRSDFHLPVVFLTAYSEDSTLERATHAQPFGYLLKPFEDRELRTAIEIALYKHRADNELLRLQRLYATLSEVNQNIVRVQSPDELLAAIVRIAVDVGRFKLAQLHSYDAATQTTALLHKEGANIGLPPSAFPSAAWEAALAGRVGVCHDVLRDAASAERAAAWRTCGVRSFAAAPFHFGGGGRGILIVAAAQIGFFAAPEIKLLEEIAMDITFALEKLEAARQRDLAEAALRDRERQYRHLLDHLHAGVVVHAPDTSILFCNEQAGELLGLSVAEMVGKAAVDPAWSFLNEDGTSMGVEDYPVRRTIASGAPLKNLVAGINRPWQKEPVWVLVNAFPELDPGGRLRQVVVTFIDITERKRSEEEREKLREQLLQAKKVESVGRLAGGVAHDFNNMLMVILGNSSRALLLLEPDHQALECILEIETAAQRSAELTRQLLTFARKQTIAPQVLDLNAVVAGTLKMLRRLIGEDVDLVWVPGAALWTVKMDPSQVDQVLTNLCVNARDAIDGAGQVTIGTANVSLDAAAAAGQPDCAPGDYVQLAVSDTGRGMDAETQAHLFEPFFTTKELGKGTGLGLATVFGILKQNGGGIDVTSDPGRGTTIRMYLPRFGGDTAAAEAVAGPRALPGNETVLLVEDEEQVLRLSQRILEAQGYKVMPALHAEAALGLAAAHPGPIHLLITDVIMPRVNGKELFEKLRVDRPEMKCLFVSGYTDELVASRGILEKGVAFLQKPFAVETLASKVREVLEGA